MAEIKSKEIETWILKFANNSRKKIKIKPLRSNSGLRLIARRHSADMAKSGRVWHGKGVHIAKNHVKRKNWELIFDIISDLLLGRWDYRGYSGENCHMMPLGQVKGFKKPIRAARDIAWAMHKGWMKSPGHRRNILDGNFGRVGVGVERKENKFYATQLFYE